MPLRAAEVRRRKWMAELRRGRMVRAACAQAGDFELLLPELVSHVLGLLPPRDVCRARAVCKRWNELVSSPGFVRQHGERAGNACTDVPTVAVVGFGNWRPVVGFHTELERWVRLPTLLSHRKGSYSERADFEAATKGLYIYNVTETEDSWRSGDNRENYYERIQLVVFNPWTGATKWLPRMLNERGSLGPTMFTLDIVDDGRAYIITAINADKQRGEVYDSRLEYWSAFNAPLDPIMVDMPLDVTSLTKWRCVRLMGSLYFVASDSIHQFSRYVISFNLESHKWALVYDMPVLSNNPPYRLLHLTTCYNKLVLMDMWDILTSEVQSEYGGRVFTLDMEHKVLVHETFIPKALALTMLHMADVPGFGFDGNHTTGMGHLLCIYPRYDKKLTAYDFRTKMWRSWAAPGIEYRKLVTGQLVDVQLSLLPV